MPRWPIALALLTATITASPPPAGAADDPPRVCVAVSATAPRCHRSATFEQGRPVVLRASRPGTVWRRAPRGQRYLAVGRTDGRGHWTWIPARHDVHPGAPYALRITTAAGTPTNTVEVWIFPRHG